MPLHGHWDGLRSALPTIRTGRGPYFTALHNIEPLIIVQFSTVPYNTVQYSTVQYSTVQYSTVQYSTVQYSTVQYTTFFY